MRTKLLIVSAIILLAGCNINESKHIDKLCELSEKAQRTSADFDKYQELSMNIIDNLCDAEVIDANKCAEITAINAQIDAGQAQVLAMLKLWDAAFCAEINEPNGGV